MSIPVATQEQLQLELGDQDTLTLSPFIEGMWDNRIDKDSIIPGLRYEYTKRDATDVLIGQVWNQVNTTEGDQKASLTDKLTNLQKIRVTVQNEINLLETRSSGVRAPATGCIVAKTPTPVTGQIRGTGCPPNPNDPAYRGDAQRSTNDVMPF